MCIIYMDLLPYEKKIYSQNGEDGIVEQIFNIIGTTNKYYLELGVEDGKECNTRNLRKYQWTGIMMDGSNENKKIGLYKHYITYDNILKLCYNHNIPIEFDLLSIDIDYNNFYILYKLLKSRKYFPRLIITECSAWWDDDRIVVYDPQYTWDLNKSKYVGGGPKAYNNLFSKYGYTIIYNDISSVNLFAIQNKYAYLFKKYTHFVKPTIEKNMIAFIKDIYKRDCISSSDVLSSKIKVSKIISLNDIINNYLKTLRQYIGKMMKYIQVAKWKNVDLMRNKIVKIVLENIKTKEKYKNYYNQYQ